MIVTGRQNTVYTGIFNMAMSLSWESFFSTSLCTGLSYVCFISVHNIFKKENNKPK